MIKTGRRLIRALADIADAIRDLAAARQGTLHGASSWDQYCPRVEPYEDVETKRARQRDCPCESCRAGRALLAAVAAPRASQPVSEPCACPDCNCKRCREHADRTGSSRQRLDEDPWTRLRETDGEPSGLINLAPSGTVPIPEEVAVQIAAYLGCHRERPNDQFDHGWTRLVSTEGQDVILNLCPQACRDRDEPRLDDADPV